MKTFSDYLLHLQEMPFLNDYITRNRIEKEIEDHDKFHLAARSKHIGNGSFTYTSDTGISVYFRKNKRGLPEELNYIDQSNTQLMAYKRNGSVKVVIEHMLYHIKKHGELKTDTTHSPGAKHLWINFIKSKPKNIRFETKLGDKLVEITSNNIDQYENQIWSSKSMRYSDIAVRAYVSN